MPGTDPADRQYTNHHTGAFSSKPPQPLRGSRRLYTFQNEIANFTFLLVTNALAISPHVPVAKLGDACLSAQAVLAETNGKAKIARNIKAKKARSTTASLGSLLADPRLLVVGFILRATAGGVGITRKIGVDG